MFFSVAAVEVGEHLYWKIAGLTLHGQVLLVSWLGIAIIFALAILGTSNSKSGVDQSPEIPTGLQNFMESVFEYVTSIAKDQLGEYEYRPWVPFVGTLFFICFQFELVRGSYTVETYTSSIRGISCTNK